jgi:hypothetical protein
VFSPLTDAREQAWLDADKPMFYLVTEDFPLSDAGNFGANQVYSE